MPVSVRFALRSPKKGQPHQNPHPLEVWITVNSGRVHFGAVWPVGTGSRLTVNPADWNVAKQCSTRRDDPVNRKLNALKAHIEAIFDSQHRVAPPTIASVVYELTESRQPAHEKRRGWLTLIDPDALAGTEAISEESSLLDAYRAQLITLKIEDGSRPTRTQKINQGRWERGLFLLEEWQRQTNQPVPPCYRVTLTWLKTYHRWLQKQQSEKQAKPISGPMASRYVGKVGKVLQLLVEDDLLSHNPAKKQSWPRYDDKEITFLEPEHVRALFALNWKGTKGVALWWFLLMCCTGLDHPDALAYVRDRRSLEREGPTGRKLVGNRLKSPCEPFDVPLLDEVAVLFSRYPNGPRVITGDCVNRYTDQIEGKLGITWRITAKTARKTFGCLMLISGYYVGEVSRMLGHRRISTTESHYVRILGTAVDRARQRVGKTTLL